MKVRLAIAEEAPALWEVRNQAIRHGCRESYAAEVLQAWTLDNMPEGYRHAVRDNPFFVVDDGQGKPVASGYLDIKAGSVEAIFTLPTWGGKGCASMIMAAIIGEAKQRKFRHITLDATPNAAGFYLRLGFTSTGEKRWHSNMANADLRCESMILSLD